MASLNDLMVSFFSGLTTIPISGGNAVSASTAAALSTVSVTTASTNSLAANASRKGLVAVNEGAQPALLAYSTVAASTSYTYTVPSGGTFEMPQPPYRGAISLVTASSTATVRLTELT